LPHVFPKFGVVASNHFRGVGAKNWPLTLPFKNSQENVLDHQKLSRTLPYGVEIDRLEHYGSPKAATVKI